MFPLPLSGPVVRKSKSIVQDKKSRDLSAHIDPLWFPGAGGVRMTLFERTCGRSGLPWSSKLGMVRKSVETLKQESTLAYRLEE